MNDTLTRDGSIEIMMEELEKAEDALELAKNKVVSLRSALNDRLGSLGRANYEYNNGQHLYRVTRYKVAPITVDFERLIESRVLSAQEMELITERTLSKKRLEEAVETGRIKGTLIAPFLNQAKEEYRVRFQTKSVPSDGSD